MRGFPESGPGPATGKASAPAMRVPNDPPSTWQNQGERERDWRPRSGVSARRSGPRVMRPLSPPQKLAQRVEQEINPLDFLGEESRSHGKKATQQHQRPARATHPRSTPNGAAIPITSGASSIQTAKTARGAAMPGTPSSACEVALMLLEKMERSDLELVAAEAPRRSHVDHTRTARGPHKVHIRFTQGPYKVHTWSTRGRQAKIF